MSTDTAPAHSILSPSHAYQWTECTASVPFKKANAHRLPKDTSSSASIEGTKAHAVCESMLREETPPGYATEEMLRHGRDYTRYVLNQRGPSPHSWGIEHRVKLYYFPKQRGTVDFYAANDRGVFVTDYKYGYGEVVSANNRQMAAYARSIVQENFMPWDINHDTPITMTIFQPRLPGDPEPWVTTWRELFQFTEDVITPKAKLILAEPDWPEGWDEATPPAGSATVFRPDDAVCKFCPAAAICKARHQQRLSSIPELDDLLSGASDALPEVTSLERQVWLVNNRKTIEGWLDDMQSHIDGLVNSGVKVPGRKVVLSKGGHRKWSSPEKAGNLLTELGIPADEVWTKQIITPAQAEKLFTDCTSDKAIELMSLIFKPPGSRIIVAESDPRPEVAAGTEEAVGELLNADGEVAPSSLATKSTGA